MCQTLFYALEENDEQDKVPVCMPLRRERQVNTLISNDDDNYEDSQRG